MHSISTQHGVNPDGSPNMVFDPEMIKYRMMDIDTENFPAFARAYKYLLLTCKEIVETQNPAVAEKIAGFFATRADAMLVSTTAASSHHGKFLQTLLQDKREVKYIDGTKVQNPGFIDRLAHGTQSQDQPPPPQ